MKLLVDIGNTQVKYVFQLVENEKSQAQPFTDIVSLGHLAFQQALSSELFAKVSEIIVANVQGNEILDAIKAWTALNNIAFMQVHSQRHAFGVTSSYHVPERLGVDRWLVMIAAHKLYPQQNVIIVDAGTATTIDLLSAEGKHLGGWIMPGVQTMFASLLNNTKKIAAKSIATDSLLFGDDSSECVNYGLWAMTIGAIKEAIVQASKLLVIEEIVITGGNGPQIVDLLNDNVEMAVELIPELIFYGLNSFHTTREDDF